MGRRAVLVVLAPALAAGCSAVHHDAPKTTGTLAQLRSVKPDVQEAKVEGGLEQAMAGYRRFLEETPETSMTPRRCGGSRT